MSSSTSSLHIQLEEDGSSSTSTWRIPRPSINSSSTSSSSSSVVLAHKQPAATLFVPALTQYQRNLHLSVPSGLNEQGKDDKQWSSRQSTSSSSATEGSQSLLLCPNRLEREPDSVSLASSMNFTLVNGMTGARPRRGCYQGKHQLTILLVTMTFVLLLGILGGVLYIQIRARDLRHT